MLRAARARALVSAAGVVLRHIGAAVLLAAFALVVGARATAQDAIATPGAVLLPPPADYETMRTHGADWTFPAHGRREAASLENLRRSATRTLADELGLADPGHVTIRLARNPTEMDALAPRGAPPPSYADGVAYPDLGVILLTRTGRNPASSPNLETTLVHELSHVLLHRAVGGRDVPRWFTEGLAIHTARENSLERTKLLWEATAQRRLVPFAELPRAFADGSHEVDVAYAQAADVVAYLHRVDDGPYKMKRLIAGLRNGATFEKALEASYFVDLRTLEREWRKDLWDRHSAYPLIVGGTGLWAIATVFLVIAYVKRRRFAKRKLARWAHEEAETARLETEARAAERRRLAAETSRGAAAGSESSDDVAERPSTEGASTTDLLDAPAGKPLVVRDERVPTVEHDGRTYTLH